LNHAKEGTETVKWVDDPLGKRLLPFVLSIIAGSVDVIGFLGLGGLFIAHITGNLVILAAKLVVGDQAPVAHLISVPVFIVVLAVIRVLAAGLERIEVASLLPLLFLQLVLLSAFLAISMAAGPRPDPNAANMVFAAMLGVAAMAVQNALVRLSLTRSPSTAVMTTNVTGFTMDVGEMLLGRDANRIAEARERANVTWPAITGFLLGCALGALSEATLGLRSLVLPTSLAVIAIALGVVRG
jgi:uncharacterized membrane protein YoaK (UPF0700 family)